MSSVASVVSSKKPKWIPASRLQTQYVDYEPFGACKQLFGIQVPEIIITGPAGTGKSRAALEKANWILEKYKNIRGIMVRKTRRSMTQSCVVTYETEVMPTSGYIPFNGTAQEYRYPNGSIFALSGLDDAQKLFSSQWDFVYVNQAEELTEDEWQKVRSRIRNFKMPYQQLLGDANPGPPNHWIKTRSAAGVLYLLESRHEDNPVYWDSVNGEWTEKGRTYVLGTLEALTGASKKRLRYGIWASAEGAVYEESWDPAIHVIDRFLTDTDLRKDQVPKTWPRYWVIDFGYTNPFVWQAWAEDPDGRLFMYKEIYMTKTIVEDHCKVIKEHTKDEPAPRAVITDHDAEDRATFEKHMGMPTKGAFKSVSVGIQAVENRLRIAGDGKARLFYLRDSLIQVDQRLLASKLPTCTKDEYEVYVWDESSNRKRGEEPVKKFDHGCDCTRYLVAHVDEAGKFTPRMFGMISVTKSGSGDGSGLTRGSSYRMQTNAPRKFQ